MTMQTISVEHLSVLMNAKLMFHQNPSKRDAFIDMILTNHPTLAVNVLESIDTDSKKAVMAGGVMHYLTKAEYRKMELYMQSNKIVEAIKLARACMGIGLKDGKDFVEKEWPQYISYLRK